MRFKLIAIALGVCFIATKANAQKMEITNAILQYREALKDPKAIVKAKENIDKAGAKEAALSQAKFWSTRGDIYMFIAASQDESIKALVPDTAALAGLKSYMKAVELEKNEKGEFTQKAMMNLYMNNRASIILQNNGIEQFKKENWALAAEYFDTQLQFNPKDTSAYINAITAHIRNKNFDATVKTYDDMRAKNFANKEVAKNVAYALDQSGSVRNFRNFLTQAMSDYPGDPDFLKMDLNYYLKRGQIDKVISSARENIAKEPNNGQLYFVLGNYQDEQGKTLKKGSKEQKDLKKEALSNYKKAVELDPSLDYAWFNLGVADINSVEGTIDSLNKLPFNAPKPKIQKLENRIKLAYTNALKNFEMAYKLKPKSRDYVNAMYLVHGQLKNSKEMDRFSSELDAIDKAAEKGNNKGTGTELPQETKPKPSNPKN